MCGIAGILKLGTRATTGIDITRAVEAMTAAQIHRGPDAGSVWTDPSETISLGHRRLAIVDLSPRGQQPMRRPGSPYTIVFNGEIYNFRPIRETLVKDGFQFASDGDTEVILAAVEKWGLVGALERIEGAFAFALWDERSRTLSLARDRTGQKPLHFAISEGCIVFSSELRPLLRSNLVRFAVAKDIVGAYLQYGYVPEPDTLVEGVKKLPPASFLCIQEDDCTLADTQALLARCTRYWSPADYVELPSWSGSYGKLVNDLEATLREVVEQQLACDVPVGVFLSGGIDSSLVAAMVSKVAALETQTFSIQFAQTGFDESSYAEDVARHLGLRNTKIRIDEEELLASVKLQSPLMDEPTGNPSYFPLQLMSIAARREVTVALTGDGGDELFCGYNRYRHLSKLLDLREWRYARALAFRVTNLMQENELLRELAATALRSRFPQLNLEFALGRLSGFLAAESPAMAYRSSMQTAQPGVLRDLLDCPPKDQPVGEAWGKGSWIRRMMLDDMGMYMPGDNLCKVDRASMKESLEIRLPLLDRRVAEFALRISDGYLLRGGKSKAPLRSILERHIPSSLIDRPKMGFTVPIADWLQGPLQGWAEGAIGNPRINESLGLSHEAIQHLWHTCKITGRQNNSAGVIWATAMLAEWVSSINAREVFRGP